MQFTKLFLLAAFVALGAIALMQGSGLSPATPAGANVAGIKIDPEFLLSGDTVKVTVTVYSGTANVTIKVTGGDDPLLTVLECWPEHCGDEGKSGESVIVGKDDVETIELSLTATCSSGDTVLVVSASRSSFPAKTEEVECRGPNLSITNIAPGASVTEKFDYSITATGAHDCEGEFQLAHEGNWGRNCPEEVEFTIAEAVPAGWTLSRIDCEREGGLVAADVVVDRENKRVRVTFSSDTNRLNCTFRNARSGPSGTPTASARITVSSAATSMTCSGTNAITAVVRNSADQLVPGANVVFTATAGSLNPTSATTNASGAANSVFTPPSSGGNVTITATAGTTSGTRSVSVTCEGAAPTSTSQTALPTPVATLPVITSNDSGTGGSIIRPPSTGDGGVSK